MRAKTRIVSFVLAALLLVGLVATASAAETRWFVTENNNIVVSSGLTEVMGRVKLTENVGTTTSGSTIILTYGAAIQNSGGTWTYNPSDKTIMSSKGVVITLAGANFVSTPNFVTFSANVTTSAVSVTIPGGIDVSGGGYSIAVDGVRADVTGVAEGTSVSCIVSSLPSDANTFDKTTANVATPKNGLSVTVTGATVTICNRDLPGFNKPVVTLTEGFQGAFYSLNTVGDDATARARYGAGNGTKIHIVVTDLPSGVTVGWPETVTVSVGIDAETSTLTLDPDSTSSDVVYDYSTTSQGAADQRVEEFVITFANIIGSGTAADNEIKVTSSAELDKQATAAASLYPQDTSSHPIVRFQEIMKGGGNFIKITRCVTNLLFPYVTNIGFGYDTGIAIANTTKDPWETGNQKGTITFYFYPQTTDNGATTTTTATAATPITATTAAALPAGDVWEGSMSGNFGLSSTGFAGGQGYIIAICNFQRGHGFAFITQATGGTLNVAQGYLALIVPNGTDPRDFVEAESLGE